jgi:exodeoxyribonuclease VII small subunit
VSEAQPQSQVPAAGAGETPQTETQTYEAASARIEEIIRRLDSGEAGLNETVALVGEGKKLIEFCAHELESVSGTLEELRLDELVEQLERGATAGADAAGPAGAGAAEPTQPQ